MRAGILYIVPTPIGNLEDITLRALRILKEVDWIAAEDTRRTKILLEHYGLFPAKKEQQIISYFQGNEALRTKQIIEKLKNGQSIALLSDAGMPLVSDPGSYLLKDVLLEGIHVEVLPGANAALTALVGSGFSTEKFIFFGFLPRIQEQRLEQLSSRKNESATMIFYETGPRLIQTLKDIQSVYGESRHVCVAREITKIYEEYKRGTVAQIIKEYQEQDAKIKGEITIIVKGEEEKKISEVELLSIEEEIRYRLEKGDSVKMIANTLSLLYAKPRRQVYRLVLLLQEGRRAKET